jgi:hypothetical protein
MFASFNTFRGPSINNRGVTAFLAGLKTGGAGIFTSNGEKLPPLPQLIASSRASAMKLYLSMIAGQWLF